MPWARKNRDYFWALAALGLAIAGTLIFGLVQFADQSDAAAKSREEAVIENGFSARVHELEALVVPNAVWDEAVRNLDNHFNAAWAGENVGQFLDTNGAFNFAYVLNAQDQARYGMRAGEDVAPASFAEIEQGVALPVAAVRRAEAAHRANPHGARPGPLQSSALRWIDERLYVVTATLVQSDFDHASIREKAAPIILTGRELDEGFMQQMAARYLLQNLHLHEGDSEFEARESHVVLRDEAGAAVATLDWSPQTPGTYLLNSVLPWLVGVLAALLSAALVLYQRARRAAAGLEESEKRTLHMAYHDGLTGIFNRAHFEEMLTDLVVSSAQSGKHFAVQVIDLDRFKELNDTYGHHTGDELLKQVAQRLSGVCHSTIATARLGGDEFAVLQYVETAADAEELAKAIISAVCEPFELSVGQKVIGCSIGAALTLHELLEPFELLRRADTALYRAKADGRGCFRAYDREMDDVVKTMRRLKQELGADIAAGKLRMVYQPQVRLNGEVVGVEALVRWTSAEQGPISPAIFVPLAEEAGLIRALGDFTLRQAAHDCAAWPHLKTAVNVSATQIQDPAFVERVKAIVADAGISPSQIEIELTEGVFFSDESQTKAALAGLHDAGFSIALDDFGTGYSSLSYLQRYPIDKIKIDRSFVTLLGKDPKADALFGAIVKLAQALEMRVIAEGVETNEQWLRLAAAGCPKIQGYIASRPIPAADLAALLDAGALTHPEADETVAPRRPALMA